MFNLVIADDEGKQTTVPVVRDEISIGRKEGNTIRLTERNVSRNHGKLVKVNGTIYFEEVSARYGTLWNGEKVRGRTELKFGDILTVGDYRLFLANQDGSIPDAVKRQLEPEEAAAAPEKQRDATEVLTMQPRPSAPTMGEPGKLCILNTEYAGQEYALLGDKMVIGRTADNDIMIDHKSISRNHARVEREGGIYRITDMGSANGITVNGEPRQTAELRRGDNVELGNVKLRYIAPGEMWAYAPGMADISAEAVPADSGGGMGKMIAILVVVLLLVGGGVAVMVGGGGGNGGDGETEGEGGSAGEGVAAGNDGIDPGTDPGNDGASTTPGTADLGAPDTEAHQLALDSAGLLMEEKRWDDVVETLSQVPDASPLSAQADQMEVRARAEMRHRDTFNQATQFEADGNGPEALSAYARIPEDSAYHSDATESRNRIKEALITEAINACQASLNGNDFDDARTALQPALALFPGEERLTSQMSAIDEAEEEYNDRRRQPEDDDDDDDDDDDRRPPADEDDDDDDDQVAVVTPDDDDDDDDDDGGSDELSPSERRSRASDLIRDARREGIRGNHDAAIELLEEAKDLNPGESRIYLMLYTNYSRQGDDRDAARALREYLRREPNDPNAGNYRDIIEELEN